MKHNLTIINMFTKKELSGHLIMFLLFFMLAIYSAFYSLVSFMLIIMFGAIPFIAQFINRSKKKFSKVWRINNKNDIARLNVEYWELEKIRKLDRNYFWNFNNKLIPVGEEINGEFKPVYVFNLPRSQVTSGAIFRSGVQDSTEDLMKKESNNIGETVKFAILGIIVGVELLALYSMYTTMMEKIWS